MLELDSKTAKIAGTVPAGKILVDGLGVGDVGNIVLRDRKHLSQDGLIIVVVTISHDSKEIVSKPDVISRGFVYVREAESLIEGVKHVAGESISDCLGKRNMDWSTLKSSMKASVAKYIYEQTKRSPMICLLLKKSNKKLSVAEKCYAFYLSTFSILSTFFVSAVYEMQYFAFFSYLSELKFLKEIRYSLSVLTN